MFSNSELELPGSAFFARISELERRGSEDGERRDDSPWRERRIEGGGQSITRRVSTQFLYTTSIRPILEYASTAWCSLSQKDNEQLERIQRRAARLIVKEIPRSDTPHDLLLGTLRTNAPRVSQKVYPCCHGSQDRPPFSPATSCTPCSTMDRIAQEWTTNRAP